MSEESYTSRSLHLFTNPEAEFKSENDEKVVAESSESHESERNFVWTVRMQQKKI